MPYCLFKPVLWCTVVVHPSTTSLQLHCKHRHLKQNRLTGWSPLWHLTLHLHTAPVKPSDRLVTMMKPYNAYTYNSSQTMDNDTLHWPLHTQTVKPSDWQVSVTTPFFITSHSIPNCSIASMGPFSGVCKLLLALPLHLYEMSASVMVTSVVTVVLSDSLSLVWLGWPTTIGIPVRVLPCTFYAKHRETNKTKGKNAIM